jgi:hypothetical protein
MTWLRTRRLNLFFLFWIPAVCFGQTAGGGSSTASSPLNVYAPPCISQVKQYVAVNCQITPTGGAQPYGYAFTGGFPTGVSMSTGLGGGLINGTPTGITGEQTTLTVTDARGGTASTSFTMTPAGLTGSGPCGTSICVTGAGYAIKTADGYTITTLATVQMTATTYWSDGSTLDVTSMATWSCTPSPQCGSLSASGLYTTGNSVGTYRVAATFSGVTNNGGSGVAVTVATIHGDEGSPATAQWHTRGGVTEGRMRHRCAFNPQVRCGRWWELRARRHDLPRRSQLSRAVERSVNDRAWWRQLWLAGGWPGH